MRIDTAAAQPTEVEVQQTLAALLDRYDTRRWHFADRVVIKDGAISHSHPVLTLGTMFIVPGPFGVLSTFLHEQIHWFLSAREDDVAAAIEELRVQFPDVPDWSAGGGRTEFGTYLHLLVNWLELESLRQVIGHAAEDTLREAVDGRIYGWIYRQVFDRHNDIRTVIIAHGLDKCLQA